MSKKNLDKLFNKKFKGFSEIPDEKVWEGINNALNEKKKRGIILPFWWKLGGIAAVLAIALYVINPFAGPVNDNQVVTDVEQQKDSDVIENSETQKDKLTDQKVVEDAIVDSETNGKKKTEFSTGSTLEPSNSKRQNENINDNDRPVSANTRVKTEVVVNDSEKNSIMKRAIDQKINADRTNSDQKQAIVRSDAQGNPNIQNKKETTDPSNLNPILKTTQNNLDEEGIAMEEETLIAEEVETPKAKEVETPNKKSIFDEIKAQEEAEDAKVATNDDSKWSVGANVAPVYFSSIGEGSPIHSSFVPNSKSGEFNLSYGLSVAYTISKRLSVRSGVHKVDYGYDTNDVEFSSSFEASANGLIQNIDYTVASENVFVASKTSANALRENVSFDAANQEASRDGVITQQFGYLEIPVELNYALVDKRFGVNLVGGVSSLFLVDNSVALSSGQLTTEIGKANNINSVNFSANAGFGVNYKVSPKVQLNVEPVFKYQLNTFSNDSGNFQPFSVGVYSGLSFKF